MSRSYAHGQTRKNLIRKPHSQRGSKDEGAAVTHTYKYLAATEFSDIPATDLIQHQIRLKEGMRPYNSKARRYTHDKEWWLRKIVQDGLDYGMYERTSTGNGCLSQWNAAPVLVPRKGQVQPCLTFNYHYLYEDNPAPRMEVSKRVHDLLSNPRHGCFSQLDLKHGYWAIEIHLEDRHYLAFTVPGLGQLQPTRMPQGARTSAFTKNEMMHIAFGPIPEPNLEPSLFYNKKQKDAVCMAFYIDDMFIAHASFEEQFEFLANHLFPRLAWARLRLAFQKLVLFSSKITALGKIHEIDGRVSLKPANIAKILDWPHPPDVARLRSFLGVVQTARRWIKGYAEIARPLTRLTGKVDWRWEESEKLAIIVIQNKVAAAFSMFGWDPQLPVYMYTDASQYAAGCFISQRQGKEERPLWYDSHTFTSTERNYSAYKTELFAMVFFAGKFRHYLEGPQTSTIFTDHKPLVTFLTSDTHEDVYVRWAQILRSLNVRIVYIKGIKNTAADGLSRTIFDLPDCTPTEKVHQLYEAAEKYDCQEWFWKSGKGGFEEMLKGLTQEEWDRMINETPEPDRRKPQPESKLVELCAIMATVSPEQHLSLRPNVW
jgi:hypothetical protein